MLSMCILVFLNSDRMYKWARVCSIYVWGRSKKYSLHYYLIFSSTSSFNSEIKTTIVKEVVASEKCKYSDSLVTGM